jgi:hypothetical protein
MTEIWIWSVLGADARPEMPDMIEGFAVDASDGHIGEVDEATFEADAHGCLVVDTGFWIFGKKRMIPAGFVTAIDREARRVQLSCSKEDVRGAPDYDEVRRDDPAHRDEVGAYFSSDQYDGLTGDPIGPQAGPGRSGT